MRIVSLLPSTTEMAFALGLGDQVVGVTHECDYPPQAREKPVVVGTDLPSGRSSREIDRAVGEAYRGGRDLYQIDLDRLEQLEPDLILAQDLCEVCAISTDTVTRAVAELESSPRVLNFHAHTVEEILEELLMLGRETGYTREAGVLVAGLQARIERVRSQAAGLADCPRTVALEWLDPLMVGGHWVPQLIDWAGGTDSLGRAGEPSYKTEWETIREAAPEVLLVVPCGFGIARASEEADLLTGRPGWADLPAVRTGRVYFLDAMAYFSRPGPRIVAGLELLAHCLHPDRFPDRPARMLRLTPDGWDDFPPAG